MTFRTVGRRGYQLYFSKSPYEKFLDNLLAHNPLALWDAGTGLFSDAGTTAITPNGAVFQWNDVSNNNYHVSQSGATLRPTYRANVAALNTRPALEFDGGDYLLRAVSGGVLPGAGNLYNVIVIYTTTAAAAQIVQYSEGHSSLAPPNIFVDKETNNRARLIHRDDTNTIALTQGGNNTVPVDGSMVLQTARRIGAASWAVRINGVQVGTNTSTTATATTITHIALGARYNAGEISANHVGHIAHVSLWGTDVFATIEPILNSWYRPV